MDASLEWRSSGAVERDGLENRCGGDPTQGSNPCSSAISMSPTTLGRTLTNELWTTLPFCSFLWVAKKPAKSPIGSPDWLPFKTKARTLPLPSVPGSSSSCFFCVDHGPLHWITGQCVFGRNHPSAFIRSGVGGYGSFRLLFHLSSLGLCHGRKPWRCHRQLGAGALLSLLPKSTMVSVQPKNTGQNPEIFLALRGVVSAVCLATRGR